MSFSEIWFLAQKLDSAGFVVPGSHGAYKIVVNFTAKGIEVVSGPTKVPNSSVFEIPPEHDDGDPNVLSIGEVYHEFTQFDVSNNGDVMVFTQLVYTAEQMLFPLYKVDLNTGEITPILAEDGVSWGYPEYSDTQSTVLGFGVNDALIRIQDDGNGALLLAESDRKSFLPGGTAVWSPSGDQVTRGERLSVRGQTVDRIKVVSSADGSEIGTVYEGPYWLRVHGWRSKP